MANRLNYQADPQLLTGKRTWLPNAGILGTLGATRARMRAQACPDEDPGQRPTPAELMPPLSLPDGARWRYHSWPKSGCSSGSKALASTQSAPIVG